MSDRPSPPQSPSMEAQAPGERPSCTPGPGQAPQLDISSGTEAPSSPAAGATQFRGKMQMQMTKRPDFQSSDREEGPFSRKQSPV